MQLLINNGDGNGFVDYTSYVVEGTMQVTDSINVPTLLTFQLVNKDSAFVVPKRSAYVRVLGFTPNLNPALSTGILSQLKGCGTGSNDTIGPALGPGDAYTNWAIPGNITALDGQYATDSFVGGNVPVFIKATNFGFSGLLPGTTILGLKFEVIGNLPFGPAIQYQTVCYVNGQRIASPKFMSCDGTTAVFGGPNDTGSAVYLPGDVTSSSFGLGLSVNATCQIDFIRCTLYYITAPKVLATGFVTNEPARAYQGLSPTPGIAYGFQQYLYNVQVTSDEWLLNTKSVPFVPAFVNQTQGQILSRLATALAPAFFDVSGVASGDLVPFFQYDPTQNWSDVAKQFGDSARYRYKVLDKRIYYTPFGDAPLGVSYDDTAGERTFDPTMLQSDVLTVPLVNDAIVTGAIEPQNIREDNFIGDGFSGNYPLHHQIFDGTANLLLQDDWTETQFSTDQWLVNGLAQTQDPNGFFALSGALNVLGGPGALNQSYLLSTNGIELGGNLNLQHGEFQFNDTCTGIVGGVYSGPTLSLANCIAGFQITPSASVGVSASGASGIIIQPVFNGIPQGPQVVTKVNHHYFLQTLVGGHRWDRYNSVYRTLQGTSFGGDSPDANAEITFIISDIDLGSYTTDTSGSILTLAPPVVTQYSVMNQGVPPFGLYAPINNSNLNLTVWTTAVYFPPEANLQVASLYGPSGGLLPVLPQNVGPFQPYVVGFGFKNQVATIGTAGDVQQLQFYSDTLPAVGAKIKLRTWEAEQSVGRVRDSVSVASEAKIVGDDGVRLAIMADLKPQPRTSEECELAAAAAIKDRESTQFQGQYTVFDYFFDKTQDYPRPGRYFSVLSPKRGIADDSSGVVSPKAYVSPVTPAGGGISTRLGVGFPFYTWQNPKNVTKKDGQYATFANSDSHAPSYASSFNLVANNFGFQIPSGAVITGIQFDIYGHLLYGLDNLPNVTAQIFKAGAPYTSLAYQTDAQGDWTPPGNPYFGTTDSFVTFGGAGNVGLTGTPVWSSIDINDPGFGIGVSVAGPSVSGFMDFVQATVFYKLGAKQFYVSEVITKVIELRSEVEQFTISFGPDNYLEKQLQKFLQRTDQILTPSAAGKKLQPVELSAIGTTFLPNLQDATVTNVTATVASFDVGVPAATGVEVRRVDSGWGIADINRIGVFTTSTFSLPRLQRDQTFYMRMINGGRTSRVTTALRVLYPFIPSAPNVLGIDVSDPTHPTVRYDFNGNIVDIYGIEIRDQDNTSVLLQRPAASAADLVFVFDNTVLKYRNRTFYAYFFNLQWEYSPAVVISYNVGAPTLVGSGLALNPGTQNVTWQLPPTSSKPSGYRVVISSLYSGQILNKFTIDNPDNPFGVTQFQMSTKDFNQWGAVITVTPFDALGDGTPAGIVNGTGLVLQDNINNWKESGIVVDQASGGWPARSY